MKKLLFFTSFFIILSVNAQKVERIEISGEIVAAIDDLESITIYNESSNKGTITDSLGRFKMKVALSDVLQFSAVQIKSFKTKITQNTIKSKSLRIYLKQSINTLDEVVLLEYDLTGDLESDASSVKVTEPIEMPNLGDVSNLEVPDDYQSKVVNIAAVNQNDRIRYQADGIAIIGLLVNAIFKTKDKKRSKKEKNTERIDSKYDVSISKLASTFERKYYAENYNIPDDKIEGFIRYLENSEFDYNLLDPSKEIELIELLHDKSKAFLNQKSEKE